MTQGKCEACKQSGIEKVCNHCPDFIPPKEKRYTVVEVGNFERCCLAGYIHCPLDGSLCEPYGNCTKGQTLQEMVEKAAKRACKEELNCDVADGCGTKETGCRVWQRYLKHIKPIISTLIPQEDK